MHVVFNCALCMGQTGSMLSLSVLMLQAAVGIGCVSGARAAWMSHRPDVNDEQKHWSWSARVGPL